MSFMRRLRILKLLVQFLNMSMSNMSQTILIILFELSLSLPQFLLLCRGEFARPREVY